MQAYKLIQRWPTVGRVVYTGVRLVTHDWLHPCIIDTLSHCRQCGRHGQYKFQRGIM